MELKGRTLGEKWCGRLSLGWTWFSLPPDSGPLCVGFCNSLCGRTAGTATVVQPEELPTPSIPHLQSVSWTATHARTIHRTHYPYTTHPTHHTPYTTHHTLHPHIENSEVFRQIFPKPGWLQIGCQLISGRARELINSEVGSPGASKFLIEAQKCSEIIIGISEGVAINYASGQHVGATITMTDSQKERASWCISDF